MENGYIEEQDLISYWQMKKRTLHSIYKFAIKVCKCSFFECSQMDLEQFCDYMCFELQDESEDGDNVDMDDNW